MLFDFGLAKLIPRLQLEDLCPVGMTGKTGSARYMAPEVGLSEPYNAKADVYSFGIILYEMTTQTKPFNGMTLEELYKDVFYGGKRPKLTKDCPQALRELIEDCWAQSPTHRPRMRQVLERLQQIKQSQTLS